MNIQHLSYFTKLVENGRISDTANQLFISQSALTKAVKSLECEIGEPLFVREGSLMKTTQSGDIFYKYAKHALLSIEEGLLMARDPSQTLSRVLRVGMEHLIRKQYASYLIEHCLTSLKLTDLPVEWRIAERDELSELLQTGQIDIAITVADITTANLYSINMGYYDLVAIVSTQNELAKKNSVKFSDLQDRDIATYHPLIPFADQTLPLLKRHGLTPSREAEDDNSLYLIPCSDPDVVSIARYTSDVLLYDGIKALKIRDADRGIFGTYVSAKISPNRLPFIKDFMKETARIKLPARIERLG